MEQETDAFEDHPDTQAYRRMQQIEYNWRQNSINTLDILLPDPFTLGEFIHHYGKAHLLTRGQRAKIGRTLPEYCRASKDPLDRDLKFVYLTNQDGLALYTKKHRGLKDPLDEIREHVNDMINYGRCGREYCF